MQPIKSDYILGVDISNHQQKLDMSRWQASGIRFIYAKASEGTTYKDPFFVNNVSLARQAGIPIGGYHFARPSKNTAVQEAEVFLQQLGAVTTDLHPVLDLEDTDFTAQTRGSLDESTRYLVQWVRDFVNHVKQATDRHVILYTAKWYADRFKQFNNALTDLSLWCAFYPNAGPQQTAPQDFGGWTKYACWQWTDKGTLPIDSTGRRTITVDLNYAVSLEVLGHKPIVQPRPRPQPTPPKQLPVKQEAAQKVIRVLQDIYQIGDQDVKLAAHVAADYLRQQSGLPLQNQ